MKIDFEVPQDYLEEGEYDGIRLSDVSDIKRLKDSDDILLRNNRKVDVIFSYPLSDKFVFTFKSPRNTGRGFTRKQLANFIVKTYQKTYKQEDKDVGKKTPNIPGMCNRGFSNGRYGIWGHDIGDLVIGEMSKNKKGLWELGVSS